MSAFAPGHFDALSNLEQVNAAHGAVDPTTGERFYSSNAVYRHGLEAARLRVMSGDAAAVRQEASAQQKVAAFVNEQPGSLPQPGDGQPDARALAFLADWRKTNPNASREQLALYEKDLVSIYAGRRFGETPAAFEARQRGALTQVGELQIALPAWWAEADDAESLQRITATAADLGIAAETFTGVLEAVAQVADAPGGDDWTEDAFLMHGYTVTAPEGISFDKSHPQWMAATKAARLAGIDQRQFNSLVSAYFSGGRE